MTQLEPSDLDLFAAVAKVGTGRGAAMLPNRDPMPAPQRAFIAFLEGAGVPPARMGLPPC